jgi:hypothetical protein
MRIKIKTTVPMPEMPSEVKLESGSLRDLLVKVFGNTHFAKEVINPETGDIVRDGVFNVKLNGVSYYNLAQGMDTALHDGDTVAISVIMLGGG